MNDHSAFRYGGGLLISGVVALVMLGCRTVPERSALAQVPDGEDDAVAKARPSLGDVSLRRLWSDSTAGLFNSSPSPNGRYMTQTDWTSGDLAVLDLQTGQLHRLTGKGSWDESGDYAEVSRFSPDGRRVVYGWYVRATETYQIRVLDFAVDASGIPHGSDPRVVYPGGPLTPYWLFGWSPDDEILTGIYRPDNTTALGFLSVETGSLRVLKSFDWQEVHAVLSRDGRFIAYDHPSGPDPMNRDITVISADGSWERVVRAAPGNDVVMGWDPSGGSLLFHSDRSPTPALWRLPMADGRPVGEAEVVREDVRNAQPLGFAGESLYFGVVVEREHYRTASIDLDAKHLSNLATVFNAPAGGTIQALAWSPEGQHVIHGANGRTGLQFYLRAVDGTVVGNWNFDVRLRRWQIRWAPDGKSVYFPGIDGRNRAGIFQLDLEHGALELIRRYRPAEASPPAPIPSITVSSDGKTLYFTSADMPGAARVENAVAIVARDLESGTERLIHRVEYAGPVVVSPDGKWLAYYPWDNQRGAVLALYPVDGSAPRILYRAEDRVGIVGWSPGGQDLLFTTSPPMFNDPPPVQLWRVSADGGDAELVGHLSNPAGVANVSLHPDGRTIAYRAGRLRLEIWALEGLPSPGATDAVGKERSP